MYIMYNMLSALSGFIPSGYHTPTHDGTVFDAPGEADALPPVQPEVGGTARPHLLTAVAGQAGRPLAKVTELCHVFCRNSLPHN